MPVENEHKRFRGYALAFLAAACWATGGLTAKWLFSALGPETAAWLLPPLGLEIAPSMLSAGRALAAFLMLFGYLLVRRREDLRISVRSLPFLAAFGVIGMAGVHFSYFKTISLTNVATAILLEYLAPVFVLVIGVLFLGHRLTWSLPVGVGISVAGCALVVGMFGQKGLSVVPEGILWGVLSAVFFGSYSLMGSWAASRLSPFTTLVYGLGFAALFWMVVLGPVSVSGTFGDPRVAVAVVYVAVVGTIVPFGSFLMALRYIPPTNATVTSTVEPVIAGFGAYALFGESMNALQLFGGLLVLVAIAIVQLSDRELPQTPPVSLGPPGASAMQDTPAA
ncbi:MAG: DMT family transporter [Coriobacteriia bacterium]|nr:DMT family transporter [Coriobacteriia bacterium]